MSIKILVENLWWYLDLVKFLEKTGIDNWVGDDPNDKSTWLFINVYLKNGEEFEELLHYLKNTNHEFTTTVNFTNKHVEED